MQPRILHWRSFSRGGPREPRLSKALFDQASPGNRALLSCAPLLLAEGEGGARKAPEWVPLLPAGDVVVARDGRSFRNDHGAVMAAFAANKMSMPIDWDHALDGWNTAPGDGRAAAWIDKLEVRDGAMYGHVEVWTERGRASVESLEYRYISPVIFYDDNRKLVMVPRASLVNNPALMMPALCRQENTAMNEALLKMLLAGLGLTPQTATEADIQRAIDLHARGKTGPASPTLETHVPREQYDRVERELASAKESLVKAETDKAKARVDAMLKAALNDGRMIPSEREFFEKMAAAPSGIEEVEKFLAGRPVIAGASRTTPTRALANGSSGDTCGLTPAEMAVCDTGGVSYKAYAEQKQREQKKT
jgi:phage I-like protein